MSLEENISHCFREYPKMKLRIEILETENQRLQAEVARLRKAALYTMGRLQLDIDSGDRPDQWAMQDIVNKHRAALEVGK